MIVALLVTVTIVGVSGWLYTTDRFWGVEWVESCIGGCHERPLDARVFHVAGVIYTSIHHRENLRRGDAARAQDSRRRHC